jgi:antitoxin component YwqK of YwqJK toxin-antitoxin module
VRTVTTAATLPNSERAAGQHSVTTYDPQGNEIEVASYNYGVLTVKEVHTYGAQGQRTETARYNPDGTLAATTTYDAQGQRTETVRYSSAGTLFAKTTYLHTSAPQGQRIEQSACSGNCFGKEVYTYDPQGNLVEEVTYYPDSSTLRLRLVHTYDAQGQRTQTTSYEAHDPGFAVETYDAQGNVRELVSYAAEGAPTGNKTVFTYEVDALGNWVKQSWFGCSPSAAPGKYDCSETRGVTRTLSYYEGGQ